MDTNINTKINTKILALIRQGTNSVPDGALYFINPDDGLKYYITTTIDSIKYYITI